MPKDNTNNRNKPFLYTLDAPVSHSGNKDNIHVQIADEIKEVINKVSREGIGSIFYTGTKDEKSIDHAIIISLYGSWGSGKTSIIRTLEDNFNNQADEDKKPDIFTFSVWDHSGGDIRKSFIRWLGSEIEDRFWLKKCEDEQNSRSKENDKDGKTTEDEKECRTEKKREDLESLIEKKSPHYWDDQYKKALTGQKIPANITEAVALYRLKTVIGTVLGTRKKIQAKPYKSSPVTALALIALAILIINSFANTIYDGILQAEDSSLVAKAIVYGVWIGALISIPYLALGLSYIVSSLLKAFQFFHHITNKYGFPQIVDKILYWLSNIWTLLSIGYLAYISFSHNHIPTLLAHLLPRTSTFLHQSNNIATSIVFISSAIATIAISFIFYNFVAPTDTNPQEILFGSSEKEKIEDQSIISDVAIDFRNTFIEILFAIRPLLLEGSATPDSINPVIIVIDDLDRLPSEQVKTMLNELRVFTSFSGVTYPPNIENNKELVRRNLFFIIPVSTKSLIEESFNDKFLNKLFFFSFTVPTPSVRDKIDMLTILIKNTHITEAFHIDEERLANLILSSAKITYTYTLNKNNQENHKDNSQEKTPIEKYDEITIRDLKKIINHITFIARKTNIADKPLSFENILAVILFSCLEVLGKVETPSDVVNFSSYLRDEAQTGRLEWLSAEMTEDIHFRLIGIYYTLNPDVESPDQATNHPLTKELELILKHPPLIPAQDQSDKETTETSHSNENNEQENEKPKDRNIKEIKNHLRELFGAKILPTSTDLHMIIRSAITGAIEYWKKVDTLPGGPTFLDLIYLSLKLIENEDTSSTPYVIGSSILQALNTYSPEDIKSMMHRAMDEINTPQRVKTINIITKYLKKWAKKHVSNVTIKQFEEMLLSYNIELPENDDTTTNKEHEIVPVILFKEFIESHSISIDKADPSTPWQFAQTTYLSNKDILPISKPKEPIKFIYDIPAISSFSGHLLREDIYKKQFTLPSGRDTIIHMHSMLQLLDAVDELSRL